MKRILESHPDVRTATPLLWPVLLAASLVPAACLDSSQTTASVAWDRGEIDVGRVLRGTAWTGEASWHVTDIGPVEILGAQVSCGCIETDMRIGDRPFTPAVYPAATAGVVRLRVRADPGKRGFDETVPLRWRHVDEEDLHLAYLRVIGRVADAYRVEPAALHWADVDPAAGPAFTVRWTAVEEITGTPEVTFDGDGARLGPLKESSDDHGRREFAVTGTVQRATQAYEAFGRVRLVGLDPPAQAVPLRVAFQRHLHTTPERVLPLEPDGQGMLRGELTLSVVDAADHDGASLLPVTFTVTPPELQANFELSSSPPSGAILPITLSCRAAQIQTARAGSLTLHHGLDDEPPVELVWYVKTKASSAPNPVSATKE